MGFDKYFKKCYTRNSNLTKSPVALVTGDAGGKMTEKEFDAQVQAEQSRVRGKPDLTLIQAITMSLVAVMAVAVGTVYGTILF